MWLSVDRDDSSENPGRDVWTREPDLLHNGIFSRNMYGDGRAANILSCESDCDELRAILKISDWPWPEPGEKVKVKVVIDE